jgi:predicted hydrocarbon binding protein
VSELPVFVKIEGLRRGSSLNYYMENISLQPQMQVRGSVLRARKLFTEEHFGSGAWDKVLESLPEPDRVVLRGILLPAGWFPYAISERLDQAIVNVLGKGDLKVFEDIGRKSARENLSGIHKSFIRPGDPQAFLAQAKTIYKFYYSTGSRDYVPSGKNSGVLTTTEAETFSVADCLTVIGWHKEALEICGAKNVSISETKCRARGDAVCEYSVSWDL